MSFLERPTRPDRIPAINERQDFFRKAITNILHYSDSYKMQPGSSLSLSVSSERYSDSENCFGFSVMLGLPPFGDEYKKAVVLSAFLDWKDRAYTENRLSYFCGTYPQYAGVEDLHKEIGDDLLIGREKPLFPLLLDRNTISKQHLFVRSRRQEKNIVVEIHDGSVSGRPSSYGSTVFIPRLPEGAIYHTGVVEHLRRSQALPVAPRSPSPAK